jgi:hypothetical protein
VKVRATLSAVLAVVVIGLTALPAMAERISIKGHSQDRVQDKWIDPLLAQQLSPWSRASTLCRRSFSAAASPTYERSRRRPSVSG